MPDFPRTTRRLLDRQTSGHHGVNNRIVPWLLNASAIEDNTNIRTSDPGIFTRRPGVQPLGGRIGSELPGGGIIEFLDANLLKRFTTIWGGKLYRSTGLSDWNQIACGESFATNVLHHAVAGRINGNRCLGFTVAEEGTQSSSLVIFDIITDSSTHVTEISQPRALAFFEQRYWTSDGDNLYWSQILDTAGFSAPDSGGGNVLGIEPGLGGEITAIIPARDLKPRLYILKDEAILLLEPRWGSSSALIPTAGDSLDTINTNLLTLTSGIGCVATKSPQWIPGNQGADVLFLAADGVRGLSKVEQDAQAGAGFPESYGIQKWIDRITANAAHKSASAFFDNAYHLAVPLDGATQNTHIFRRDTRDNAWSLIDWQAKDIKAFRLSVSNRVVFQNNFFTDDCSNTGIGENLFQVFQGYQTFSDPGGTSVAFQMQTRAFVFETPNLHKKWDSLTFHATSADTQVMEVRYRTDLGRWNTLDTITLPSSTETDLVRQNLSLSDIPPGQNIQFQFNSITGTTESGEFSIYMIDVHAFELPDTFESGQ